MTEASLTELKQKYLNERRSFYLEPKRIRVLSKDANGEVEFYVPYEDLTSQVRYVTEQNGRLYIAAVSFGIFSLAGLAANFAGEPSLMRWVPVWIVATVILFGFHLAKRRRYVLLDLTDGKSIFFLRDKPSEQQLSSFLESVQSRRRHYLRDSYFKIDPDNDPHSEVRKFKWLMGEGIITEVELEEMKKRLQWRSDEAGDSDLPPTEKPTVH
jgi:hypothetical protein